MAPDQIARVLSRVPVHCQLEFIEQLMLDAAFDELIAAEYAKMTPEQRAAFDAQDREDDAGVRGSRVQGFTENRFHIGPVGEAAVLRKKSIRR